MKTYTPDPDPAALARLRDYAAALADDFPQAQPARRAGVYLHGLLTDGDRKSVEPLSHRVTPPDRLTSKDPEQASAKEGDTERPLTLPGIRRALQQLLRPAAKADCTYCCRPRSHPIQVERSSG